VVGGCQRHSLGRGFDPRLGVKKTPLANSTQSTWSKPSRSSWAMGPCVRVGKAHVPKHKLRTGPWVVLTGDGPLCMGGCGVHGVFSACMRRLLLNIKPWGWSFPYRSSFFYCVELGKILLPLLFDFVFLNSLMWSGDDTVNFFEYKWSAATAWWFYQDPQAYNRHSKGSSFWFWYIFRDKSGALWGEYLGCYGFPLCINQICSSWFLTMYIELHSYWIDTCKSLVH
jgi:hypothetical protein